VEAQAACAEREALERFVRPRIAAGGPLRGLYPPGEEVQQEYERWRAAGEPEEDEA
jgi:hypothetical protein